MEIDEDIQANPAIYFNYYERQRREKEFKMFGWRYVCNLVFRAIILIILISLYAANDGKEWGESFGSFVLSDIWLKVFILLFRGFILLFSKSSSKWMECYKWTLSLSVTITFLWNIVMLVIFSLSVKDWEDESTLLFVASIFIIIEVCFYILICWWAWCLICLILIVSPNNPQNNEARENMRRDKNYIIKITKELYKLKANESNFKPGEDQWCICMEYLELNSDVIVLPCHANHCMHYNWIAEWISTRTMWPMCK